MPAWAVVKNQAAQAVVATAIAPAAGQVWAVLYAAFGTDSTSLTLARAPLQRSTGGVTPTGFTPQALSTRSPAYAGTVNSNWTTAPTLSGNPLIFFSNQERRSTRFGWRPPRPWAMPLLLNSEQVDYRFNGGGNATLVLGDPFSLSKVVRRRPRRPGVWHYANEQGVQLQPAAVARTQRVQWVARVTSPRARRDHNWLAYYGGAAGVTVAPGPAAAIGRTVAPTVVLGSLALTPAARSALGRVVAPTVVLGSLVIVPAARSALGRVVAPTVVLGSLTLSPTPVRSIGRVVAPAVQLGSVLVTPAPASALGRTVSPTVVLGSLALTPSPASAIGRVVAPTVDISGGAGPSPVRRRIRWIYFHWRRFSRWT